MREEDHDRFLRLGRCVHAQVRGVMTRLIGGLEALESDVLASQLDQVLDSAGPQSERSSRIRAADTHRSVTVIVPSFCH